jgi:endonuclease/exonuclease/phosphatase (EEP) superfamily protein YafD
VSRLLPILVGVLALFVLGGVLDTRLWPGPVLALFRPQLTLALALAATLAILLRRPRTALAGFAIAVLGAILLLPAVRGPRAEAPAPGAETVRLLALNLWSRNDDVAAVAGLIRRERPDVVALTELTPAWARALSPVLTAYPVRAAEPRAGASGVGLYGREALSDMSVVRLFGDDRPSVQAVLTLPNGRRAALVVVHPISSLKPGDVATHRRSLAALGAWAETRAPRAAVCGDLNATPWMRSLRRVLEQGRLGAALPGGPFAGSWPAVFPPFRVPIDGCLVGAGLRARAELGPGVGSDHLPVIVELGGS